MENQTTPAGQEPTNKISDIAKRFNFFKMNKLTTLFVIFALAVIGTLFYFKSLFIAATVNGVPISRLSVIGELEKNSGQQALDIIITKKLIEAEASKTGVTVSQEDIDAEIKTIEDQVSKQGGTLEMALAQQGMTEEQFQEQLILQKKLEKILADKIQITDEEVNQYVAQSKAPVPAGTSETEFKDQIRDQLKNQKFNVEADKWITDLKAKANIQYYVGYGKPAAAQIDVPSSSQSQ